MKARFTFLLLSVAIIALLGVSAWFTMQIFNTNLTEGEFEPVQPNAPEDISITHEDSVTAKPRPATPRPPAKIPQTRPLAPKTPPSQVVDGEPMPDHAGAVVQLSGTAYKNKSSGGRVKLGLKDKIFVNDHIETDQDSRLVIVFVDNTRLSLGEKTSCVIDEYIFDRSAKTDSGFGMRLVKGACRIVTGLVTTLNPERFRVETRMATIGIRGCELGFQALPEEERIFVMGLNSKEAVVVSSTENGSALRDINTGEAIEDAKTTPLVVVDPGTLVTVSKGLGRSVRPMSPGEMREITTATTPLSAVKHTVNVRPNSTVFEITPEKRNSGDAQK